jgi:hypothetical protein
MVNVVMVRVNTTLILVDVFLGISNVFMGLQVCLCHQNLGAISQMIVVNVFVEPQVRLVRFQANRTERIQSLYGSYGAHGVGNADICI